MSLKFCGRNFMNNTRGFEPATVFFTKLNKFNLVLEATSLAINISLLIHDLSFDILPSLVKIGHAAGVS